MTSVKSALKTTTATLTQIPTTTTHVLVRIEYYALQQVDFDSNYSHLKYTNTRHEIFLVDFKIPKKKNN